MSTFLSHGASVDAIRRQVVETAEAMLNGQISFLLGARHLASLRFDVDVSGDDADFLTFVGIASETDSFPLGEIRKQWSTEALARLEKDIQYAEAWAVGFGSEACKSLITRFATSVAR